MEDSLIREAVSRGYVEDTSFSPKAGRVFRRGFMNGLDVLARFRECEDGRGIDVNWILIGADRSAGFACLDGPYCLGRSDCSGFRRHDDRVWSCLSGVSELSGEDGFSIGIGAGNGHRLSFSFDVGWKYGSVKVDMYLDFGMIYFTTSDSFDSSVRGAMLDVMHDEYYGRICGIGEDVPDFDGTGRNIRKIEASSESVRRFLDELRSSLSGIAGRFERKAGLYSQCVDELRGCLGPDARRATGGSGHDQIVSGGSRYEYMYYGRGDGCVMLLSCEGEDWRDSRVMKKRYEITKPSDVRRCVDDYRRGNEILAETLKAMHGVADRLADGIRQEMPDARAYKQDTSADVSGTIRRGEFRIGCRLHLSIDWRALGNESGSTGNVVACSCVISFMPEREFPRPCVWKANRMCSQCGKDIDAIGEPDAASYAKELAGLASRLEEFVRNI